MRHLIFAIGVLLLSESAFIVGAEPKFVELIEEGTAYEGKLYFARRGMRSWRGVGFLG